eukprot:1158669-Pelagomonas_calceolata.AAC.1
MAATQVIKSRTPRATPLPHQCTHASIPALVRKLAPVLLKQTAGRPLVRLPRAPWAHQCALPPTESTHVLAAAALHTHWPALWPVPVGQGHSGALRVRQRVPRLDRLSAHAAMLHLLPPCFVGAPDQAVCFGGGRKGQRGVYLVALLDLARGCPAEKAFDHPLWWWKWGADRKR